jgi:hypothetical protein
LNLFPLKPLASPSFCNSANGSAPGERMKTIGDFSFEAANILSKTTVGG